MELQPLVEETHTTEGVKGGWQALERIIRQRRSIRRYTDQAIPQEVLEELLEAATWAPSAHNRQPWRFCVVTSAEVKTRLSEAMGEQWRADLSADNADPAFIERRVAISHARLTGAAALVIACLTMRDMDHYPDAARARAEWVMAAQSVALACQNLLLAAEAHGLGACWMCAPLFVPELVQRVLELPADWEPQALITLGYPAESKQKEREPLASRVLWR
jgi:coenzyme F420-0:L-glutamate ligase/coenzyme F420-1:gamma-L-glutamate ligase